MGIILAIAGSLLFKECPMFVYRVPLESSHTFLLYRLSNDSSAIE